jgi:hypothetical protein
VPDDPALVLPIPYAAEGRLVLSAWNSCQGYGSQLAVRGDVPDGRHGFDVLDHNDESRQAVTAALAAVSVAFEGETGA